MKLSKEEKRRAWMRDYMQNRRKQAKQNGMCVLCYKEPVVEGKTCCPKCLANQRARQAAYNVKLRPRNGKPGRPKKGSPAVVKVIILNSFNYAKSCNVFKCRKRVNIDASYASTISISD